MCSALTLETSEGKKLFGRNMDLSYDFNQSVIFVPRNFEFIDNVDGISKKPKYASMGMASIIDNFPCYADGLNEHGLAVAGLNFPGYAYFPDEIKKDMYNIPSHAFIFWILSNFKSVDEILKIADEIRIINRSIDDKVPEATLHWMITDTTGKSIVVESTKEGVKITPNPVGVLTNSPEFKWHLTNLNEYIKINPNQPADVNWVDYELKPLGVGMGTKGLPGGFSGEDRFIRLTYLKSQQNEKHDLVDSISQFNRMLQNVAMPRGAVITDGNDDITIYTSCMCLEDKTYTYTTYNNLIPEAICINRENLEGSDIKKYEYVHKLKLHYQN